MKKILRILFSLVLISTCLFSAGSDEVSADDNSRQAISLDKIKLGVDKGISIEKNKEEPITFKEEKKISNLYIVFVFVLSLALGVILKFGFSMKNNRRI